MIAAKCRFKIGNRILAEGIRVAKEFFRTDSIYLAAQTYTRGLYEKQGFPENLLGIFAGWNPTHKNC